MALRRKALELTDGDPKLAEELLLRLAAHQEQLRKWLTPEHHPPDVIDMVDWSSEHRDVVGYWAHVGPTEVEWDFFGEYIPYNLQGDYKKISKTTADDYWRFYLPKTKEKVPGKGSSAIWSTTM